MTWVDVEVGKKTAHLSRGAVVVSVSKKGKSLQRIFVTVRNGELNPPVPFWKPNAMVRVQMGSGADAGKVRMTPSGPHKLSLMGKQGVGRGTTLQFPLPATIVSAGERSRNVEFDYNDGWIEITLPAWAKVVSPAEKMPPPAAGKAPSLSGGVFRTTATIGAGPRPATGGR